MCYHVMLRLWLSVGRIEEIETYWRVLRFQI